MKEKLQTIFSTIFNIDLNDYNFELSQDMFEKWDSINHIKLIALIEEAFEIEFEEDDIFELTSINEIINKLSSLKM